MDKSILVELVYEFAEKNKYDKRFLPFFQAYIGKCTQMYNWNENELKNKLEEYSANIKNINFLNVGRQRINVDVDNKTIVIDERIKYNVEDQTLNEYIEAAFKEQDKILKTSTYAELDILNTGTLKEEIRYAIKTYNKKLIYEKVAFEIIALVQQKNYDRKFIPFIKEYFIRSASIYNWNRDELEKKINNFKNNVDTIELKKLHKKCALYSPEDKAIYINKSLHTYANDVIIKNIFREQGFATNYTKIDNTVYENGLYSNAEENEDEKSLNAYAEEVSANYLTGRVPYSNALYTTCRVSQNDRKDYNNKVAYLGSMFAAAFGISEFEFAKLKDKGRARFNEYFRARFEYMDTEKYIDAFMKIVCDLQNAKDGSFTTKQATEQYAKMYNLAVEILNKRADFEAKNLQKSEMREQNKKINYARYKIVSTLKQARKNQCLERKVIRNIIEDKKHYRKYYIISDIKKGTFKNIAFQIHKNSDTDFDNKELVHIIVTEFKYPTLGKIFKNNKNTELLLYQGMDEKSIENFNKELEENQKKIDQAKIVVPKKELFN